MRWATQRQLTQLDLYRFDVQGYVLFEDVLDRASVKQLREAIEAQHLPPADDGLQNQRFGQGGSMFTWQRSFCDLIDHPLAIQVLRQVIGNYVRLDHAYGIVMSPGTEGLGLHGPAQPFDSSQYYVERMGRVRSGLLTLSWSLTDGRAGDGGFGCIPGSHRAAFPLPAGADSLVVEVAQPVGSLLVFTEALAHRTIRWRGRGTRLALLYKYSPGSTAWDPNPAAPTGVVASMSAQQQRFFAPPSVGGRQPTFPE